MPHTAYAPAAHASSELDGRTFDSESALLAALSNAELQTVLDGGSVRVLACGFGQQIPAWIDLDGLWIDSPDGPGYAWKLSQWRIERCY